MKAPQTDDLRIGPIKKLMPPHKLIQEIPVDTNVAQTVIAARSGIQKILTDEDDRLLAVVGPCSIHDPDAALEYAKLLAEQQKKHEDRLLIVMRVYFEKPLSLIHI